MNKSFFLFHYNALILSCSYIDRFNGINVGESLFSLVSESRHVRNRVLKSGTRVTPPSNPQPQAAPVLVPFVQDDRFWSGIFVPNSLSRHPGGGTIRLCRPVSGVLQADVKEIIKKLIYPRPFFANSNECPVRS